ncbi:MAG: cyclopropane-fatty-acyl-phospholipid synthase family protein [Aquincola sp.]|nr:cyclopropane-fatty-acyl-phospholipid synthase family protein [Aquincola sp.]MDH4288639.1 cyclopropane-fatty-acyl-phospholipid synthase family protein [Aquincola sp.]MDH5329684.1 cyclopropane-fatty-acyl-phospholipid synthase family protein [Aquincola sp.]
MNAHTHLMTVPDSAMPPAARAVFRLLSRLAVGQLDVQMPDGSKAQFGSSGASGPHGEIRLANWNVCAASLRSGDIGFAEAYIDGDWTTPDLGALLRLFVANRDAIESVVYGTWWGSLLHRFKHLLNRNSRRGSKKNIHAHYDIGNPFYCLWLDESMSYSGAWFGGDRSRTLVQAQHAKVKRALQECGVKPGGRLLEIGCGWGTLARTAASGFGAHVTALTLSTEQFQWARDHLAAAGLAARVDLRLQDYREIPDAAFDAIVSIEMFEAVGREYWRNFFATVRNKLKPGGRACVQSITIRDDLFGRYVSGTDFIQQYIFPGGLLPSPSEFRAAAREAGLEVVNELAFGADYAETLVRWRERFLAEESKVRKLGFDTRFMRTWEFYLAYCEAAFAEGNTDVIQFTLRRP